MQEHMTNELNKYFRRVIVGYCVLAIATSVGIWSLQDYFTDKFREELNVFIIQSCKNSIPTLKRFNATLDVDIDIQKDALKINMTRGDTARAALNLRAIKAKEKSKLHVPTEKECELRGAF